MKKIYLGLILVVIIITAFFVVNKGFGSTTFNVPVQTSGTFKNFSFYAATTTNATSTNVVGGGGSFVITGAKKVVMYFTHGGTATSSTAGARFKVETSDDGSTWLPFNKLIGSDVSSTATSTYLITVATSTVPVALDLSDDTFYSIRCISTELSGANSGDGEHTCTASAEF